MKQRTKRNTLSIPPGLYMSAIYSGMINFPVLRTHTRLLFNRLKITTGGPCKCACVDNKCNIVMSSVLCGVRYRCRDVQYAITLCREHGLPQTICGSKFGMNVCCALTFCYIARIF